MLAEHRRPTKTQQYKDIGVIISSVITTIILLPAIGWLLMTIVETQAVIWAVKKDVAIVQQSIAEHMENTDKTLRNNSRIHHRNGLDGCNGCHRR